MINLLILTNELNFSDGVTSHLFHLLKGLEKTNKFKIFLMYSGGNSDKRFMVLGINVSENNLLCHSSRNLKNYAKAIVSVLNFSKANKINIIHSHNHYAANIAHRVSKFINISTIQTIHGLIPEGGRLPHFRADKFICVSEPVIDYIFENKIAAKENVKLIRHGFPVIENLKPKNTDEVKILCASRLVYEKGVDTFIRAAEIVLHKYKGKIKFMIAGTGDYENELRSLSNTLKIDINFLGNINDMTRLLLETNIFVMPTRSMSEGFPMTIVEAGFTKNFIITSRFEWLRNVFENRTDGLVFEIDNYKELADKIMFALKNPEAANRMKENFHNKALKLFNLENAVEKHAELYRECLSR